MDWVKAAEAAKDDVNTGKYQDPEKMKNGFHDAEIFKIVYARGDGTKFMSTEGYPNIWLFLRNKDGEEASKWFTLSDNPIPPAKIDKNVLRFVDLLGAIGVDIGEMQKDGVHIEAFAEPSFGNANLVHRRLKILVKRDDLKFPYVDVVGPSDTIAEPTEPAEQVEEKEEVKLPF